MKIWISAVHHALPENVVTNTQIIEAHSLKIKASWVENMIGIRERRWAPEGVAASDLAAQASRPLIGHGFGGSIWVSTISQDYLTPSTASILKGKLGVPGDLPAYDVSAACAGHLFALELAMNR